MFRLYKVKYEKKPEDLLNLGYDFMPFELVDKENILFKIVKLSKESKAYQMVVNVFNNAKWQEESLIPEAILAYEELGVKWEDFVDEEGNVKKTVIEDEHFIEMYTTWRIEIDMEEDKLVGFTTGDMSFPYTFYNRDILDMFCEDEINKLFEEGLIIIEEAEEE